jgi:2-amino-4-hydroxy-6-hydroxymethyldihydropteridine diphosphokinase
MMPAAAGWVTAYLGLGGNQGDRLALLRRALQRLAEHPAVELLAVSQVHESEFVGPGRQDPYLNACARIKTTLAARDLLCLLKEIEGELGRRPESHMQPRPVDLDLLLFGGQILSEPDLEVPHPRMRERAFVLEPLAQLGEHVEFPDSGETVGSACAKIRRKSGPWIEPRPQWNLRVGSE